jgi:carbamoyl-phosphate synthase large subunit
MCSPGDSMSSGASFGEAFARASQGCGQTLPLNGNALLGVVEERQAYETV